MIPGHLIDRAAHAAGATGRLIEITHSRYPGHREQRVRRVLLGVPLEPVTERWHAPRLDGPAGRDIDALLTERKLREHGCPRACAIAPGLVVVAPVSAVSASQQQ